MDTINRYIPNTDNPYPIARSRNTLNDNYPMSVSNPAPLNKTVIVTYNGQPYRQTLSQNGPYMYQSDTPSYRYKSSCICYPTTHSIPGPYLQSYINMPFMKTYMY